VQIKLERRPVSRRARHLYAPVHAAQRAQSARASISDDHFFEHDVRCPARWDDSGPAAASKAAIRAM